MRLWTINIPAPSDLHVCMDSPPLQVIKWARSNDNVINARTPWISRGIGHFCMFLTPMSIWNMAYNRFSVYRRYALPCMDQWFLSGSVIQSAVWHYRCARSLLSSPWELITYRSTISFKLWNSRLNTFGSLHLPHLNCSMSSWNICHMLMYLFSSFVRFFPSFRASQSTNPHSKSESC